jgi:thioredoxin reductase (NADPH)
LRDYGTEEEIAAGDVLFAEGDETYDLIVVLEGEVQIVAKSGRPTESVIATYGPNQFLGEIGLLTGQRAFLAAVARTAGRYCAFPSPGCGSSWPRSRFSANCSCARS